MASTTQTCSLAQPSVIPQANHTVNVLSGFYSGILSASASARLLLAKVPATAKRVQVSAYINAGGAATQVLNFGLKSGTEGSNTFTVSAYGQINCSVCAGSVMFVSPPLDMTDRWNQVAGETYKYVTASLQSGTTTASLSINYQITYSF